MLAIVIDCTTEYAQRTFIDCVQLLSDVVEQPRTPRHDLIGAITALIAAAAAVAALTTGKARP